ncbi:MAG: hypothetical protein JWR15_4381, partial [Prosthecobacter sp.]|nr:hypothetical protein [Prosthecobacter sp.]
GLRWREIPLLVTTTRARPSGPGTTACAHPSGPGTTRTLGAAATRGSCIGEGFVGAATFMGAGLVAQATNRQPQSISVRFMGIFIDRQGGADHYEESTVFSSWAP